MDYSNQFTYCRTVCHIARISCNGINGGWKEGKEVGTNEQKFPFLFSFFREGGEEEMESKEVMGVLA